MSLAKANDPAVVGWLEAPERMSRTPRVLPLPGVGYTRPMFELIDDHEVQGGDYCVMCAGDMAVLGDSASWPEPSFGQEHGNLPEWLEQLLDNLTEGSEA